MLRLGLLLFGFVVQLAVAAEQAQIQISPITIGESFKLQSSILGDQREINIWLPPGYVDGDKSYPVLYVIDGGLEQDFHHISGLGQLTTINGNYEELIIVGIGTQNRLMELTFQAHDPRFINALPPSGDATKFRKYIADEVIALVEKRYRTAERRAIIGESLAGLFVLDTFLKTPELFTDYIAISPSLWWDGKALATQAESLLEAHDDKSRRLYLTMANEGGTMQSALETIISVLDTKAPKSLEWVYVDRSESETHATIYHGAALDALRRFFGLPPLEFDSVPWYLSEDGRPPADNTSGSE